MDDDDNNNNTYLIIYKLAFIEHLVCAKYGSRIFTCIISLNLPNNLGGRCYYYDLHFTDEETEQQVSSTLGPESLLVSGRAKIQSHVVSSNLEAPGSVPGTRQVLSKSCLCSLEEVGFQAGRHLLLFTFTVKEAAGVEHSRAPRLVLPPQPFLIPSPQSSTRHGTLQRERCRKRGRPDPHPSQATSTYLTECKPSSDACLLIGKMGSVFPHCKDQMMR